MAKKVTFLDIKKFFKVSGVFIALSILNFIIALFNNFDPVYLILSLFFFSFAFIIHLYYLYTKFED